MLFLTLLLSLALGFISAIAWVGWVSQIVNKSPVQAAIFDGVILLPSLVVKQLWAAESNNFLIFLAFLVGSMLGTYLGVRYFRVTR